MRWREWLEERAPGGWPVTLAVTVTLFIFLATYVTNSTAAVMDQCKALAP